jgi:uncharacterized protein YndB with AHSA1/START domain
MENINPGRIRPLGEGFEGRLERHFEQDRKTVWRMLTEPEALGQWLAPGSIELRTGGGVYIDFADSGTTIESRVLDLDPPQRLAYSWSSGDEPERPLRWELTAAGEGTRLVLTLWVPAGEDVARACAGFDAHLEMLAAALEGVPIRFPVDHFMEARRAYRELQPDRVCPDGSIRAE